MAKKPANLVYSAGGNRETDVTRESGLADSAKETGQCRADRSRKNPTANGFQISPLPFKIVGFLAQRQISYALEGWIPDRQ